MEIDSVEHKNVAQSKSSQSIDAKTEEQSADVDVDIDEPEKTTQV